VFHRLTPPSFTRSPEPHILLFRRKLGTDPQTGKVDAELQRQAQEEYQQSINANSRK
jgi:cyclin-dependent kinase regulatory subunit CKS1